MSNETTLITDSPTDAAEAQPTAPGTPEGQAATAPAAAEATAAAGLSAEEVETLRAQAAKAEEYRDRHLRTAADFENFKKRAARERQEAVRFANEALLGKLVSVLDNFEIALGSEADASAASGASFRSGVALIQNQLKNVLLETGLEEIDATGQPFNPNFHEAVAQHESAEVPEGQVLQQLRKGYKYRERLLRPASVVVAKPPAPPATAAEPATH